MRKLIAGFAASLDGYIEGPNGEYDWILIDKEIDFAEEAKRFDTYFYGRRSYEAIQKMKMPVASTTAHYVFSTTLSNVAKPFSLIKGNIAEEVAELKEKEGKDIAVYGGASLLASLLSGGLVDELDVAVIPVLLGAGKPMVSMLPKHVPLVLQHTKTYQNGTVRLNYRINK